MDGDDQRRHRGLDQSRKDHDLTPEEKDNRLNTYMYLPPLNTNLSFSSSQHTAENQPETPPRLQVQFILERRNGDNPTQERPPLFNQMSSLVETQTGEQRWQQAARWIKFEEKVEDGGRRWSKPHVATLSLFSLFDLRSVLTNGTIILDMDANNLETITEIILDNFINTGQLSLVEKHKAKCALLCQHSHLYRIAKSRKHDKLRRSISQPSPDSKTEAVNLSSPQWNATGDNGKPHKGNVQFLKKIAAGAEASNILVGEVNFLENPITAFVRLSESAFLGDITEVPLPTRFVFIMLGPKGGLARYHEVGRSMATLLSDEVFKDLAYKAETRQHLLAGMDEFMEAVTVLPPAAWDPEIRIEPPPKIPSQDSRKYSMAIEEVDEEEEERRRREESGLVRTNRLFGGLINDIKRKKPWYWSDFKDSLSMQSIATISFMYFACLTPIITFGGLLGEATGNNIAAMESLISGLICGVGYGFFAGQPLTILGSTGPVLVFETIMYQFCRDMEWNYLELRLWIGLWAAVILLLSVAFDASSFVCYITRFTEENFATLIALIFIIEAFKKVWLIGKKYPMETQVDAAKYCHCLIDGATYNVTDETESYNINNNQIILNNSVDMQRTTNIFNSTMDDEGYYINQDLCTALNGTLTGDACTKFYPDVLTLSLILFFGTYFISTWLKEFKTAPYFSTVVRTFISDFSVTITIVSMTALDYFIGIHTPKLTVPHEFKPTNSDRGWIVQPFGGNPWWTPIAAVLPAALVCILLFMDQQITSVIINRREHKLKKGCGYHLDLFVLCGLIAINSVMGLPWFVAATVLALNHVNSLKMETEIAAPGEKPQFLGVRENRVTQIIIFLLIGGSVFMTPLLKKIPMAVLFGVFLYMGMTALKGIQFMDRILIMFMPAKYQPDHIFLRKVPLKKVHLFTCIQMGSLAVLWVVKSFKEISILFPLTLVLMAGLRKLLDKVFTQEELKALDDLLPQSSRKENNSDETWKEKEKKDTKKTSVDGKWILIPREQNSIKKVSHFKALNITEEFNRSGIWKDASKDWQQYSPPPDTRPYDHQQMPRLRLETINEQSRSREGHVNAAFAPDEDAKVNGTGNRLQRGLHGDELISERAADTDKDNSGQSESIHL